MELKTQIQQRLLAFAGSDLRAASIGLLNTLGYQSDKTLDISSLAEMREYLDPHEYLAVMPLTAHEFDVIANEMANKSME